jgi:hypothetical protein
MSTQPIKLEIRELPEGVHRIPFRVTCKQLLHVDSCFGYRIELDGKVLTYCTDTGICNNSLLLTKNADFEGDKKAQFNKMSVCDPTFASFVICDNLARICLPPGLGVVIKNEKERASHARGS